MPANLKSLHEQIEDASGPSRSLDTLIAHVLAPSLPGAPEAPYTSSVDACLDLIGTLLPGWHWHVGHGATGILPYAALSGPAPANGAPSLRLEASAPTVPLALLRAATKAMLVTEEGCSTASSKEEDQPSPPSQRASARTTPATPAAKPDPSQST